MSHGVSGLLLLPQVYYSLVISFVKPFWKNYANYFIDDVDERLVFIETYVGVLYFNIYLLSLGIYYFRACIIYNI